jgi:hypothetical protein
MTALTADQLELLQRACDGPPMWGGSVATDRLRRDVDLLYALHLIESDGTRSYRVTELGKLALARLGRQTLKNQTSGVQP